jgi:hypothetical protein
MKLIGTYINGNCTTSIYDDGTKIRETQDDEFDAAFPENIDIKITNQCDMGCPMCHENSYPGGKHGNIMNAKFIDTLRPYTELAIGGGNALAHPDLIPFLKKLRARDIIPNLTVNQTHFMQNIDLLKSLTEQKLVFGIGVSLNAPTDEFIAAIKEFDNAVIHVINGIVTQGQLEKLADNDLKILILGYKEFRRGESYKQEARGYIEANQINLKVYLRSFIPRFKVVSFDNLAIDQLFVKELMSKELWDEFYMGDDGNFTMYIDMVSETFAKNSIAALDRRYKITDNIDDMFKRVKEESK